MRFAVLLSLLFGEKASAAFAGAQPAFLAEAAAYGTSGGRLFGEHLHGAASAFVAQAAPAGVTLSETQIAIGVLMFLSALIGYHFVFRKYIRQQAGVLEPMTRTEITGQPIEVTAKMQFVPVPEFQKFERYVHEREHLLRDEMQAMNGKLEERRIESAEQIGALRDKIDEKHTDALKANNVSATKLHERIEATSQSIRVELDTKIERVQRAVDNTPEKVVSLLQKTGAIGGTRSR